MKRVADPVPGVSVGSGLFIWAWSGSGLGGGGRGLGVTYQSQPGTLILVPREFLVYEKSLPCIRTLGVRYDCSVKVIRLR